MKNLASILVLLLLVSGVSGLSGCADGAVPDEPPVPTVRERMEREQTRLFAAQDRSAGSVRAERYAGSGSWESGLVDLHIETGELALRAAGNAILIEQFALDIAPITIPASVVGHRAQLVGVRAELVEPVLAPARWSALDDEAHVSARVELDLSWSLQVDDVVISLGAPTLPPLPVELVVTGAGDEAHAELRMRAGGEIWNWADLVRLVDLFVLVGADG